MKYLSATLKALVERDEAMKGTHQHLIENMRDLRASAAVVGRGKVFSDQMDLHQRLIEDLDARIELHKDLLARIDEGLCPFCGTRQTLSMPKGTVA